MTALRVLRSVTRVARRNTIAFVALFFALSGVAYGGEAVVPTSTTRVPYVIAGDVAGTRTFPEGQDSEVPFAREIKDTTGLHDPARPSRFLVTRSGLYDISAHVKLGRLVAPATNAQYASWYAQMKVVRFRGGVGAAQTLIGDGQRQSESPDIKTWEFRASGLYPLTTGDQVAVLFAADAGEAGPGSGDYQLKADSDFGIPFFSMHRVADE